MSATAASRTSKCKYQKAALDLKQRFNLGNGRGIQVAGLPNCWAKGGALPNSALAKANDDQIPSLFTKDTVEVLINYRSYLSLNS